MFRRLVAISMLISFIAMASSGAMMFVVEKPSFTIQMHPVHKVFGILMVGAALAHIFLNFKSIKGHLRHVSAYVAVGVLTAVLVLLYGVALNRSIPPELAATMDEAAAKAEGSEKAK